MENARGGGLPWGLWVGVSSYWFRLSFIQEPGGVVPLAYEYRNTVKLREW